MRTSRTYSGYAPYKEELKVLLCTIRNVINYRIRSNLSDPDFEQQEVSIRKNNCRTKTRWNRPETAEDPNNTPQLVKQRGKVKSFDVLYFYCHF